MTTFSVGDVVRWKFDVDSTYAGPIVLTVSVGSIPNPQMFPGLSAHIGIRGRDHESYVVRVGGCHYWPLVRKLVLVKRKAAHTERRRRGFRHKVFYEFREGASVGQLCTRHGLTRTMVETIIREHTNLKQETSP
jgi:hypothetical protein